MEISVLRLSPVRRGGVLFFVGVMAFCPAWARGKAKEPVYLSARSVNVSSFDETPTWAPPANPMAVADGNLKSRWASKPEDGQWVAVNFGVPKVVDALTLHWERAFAASYTIEASDDGRLWRRIFERKKGPGGTEEVNVRPVRTQFVRVSVVKRANPQWGVSLWEIEAFGPADLNPGDHPLKDVFPWRKNGLAALVLKREKPLPAVGPITPEEYQTGVNLTSWHESELAGPTSDQTLRHLRSKHVGYVALLTTWFQKDVDSKEISPQSPQGGQTPVDEALGHAMNQAHSLGMKVLLKPHLDVEDGTYRADVFPVEGWFDSYEKFILHYARLAREYNAEMFCVGTELRGATTWEQEGRWRDIIAKVRRVYKGSLVYAANWDEYPHVPFWDALDFIGIDAYFPLTQDKNASLPDLVDGWEKRADIIEAWRDKKGLSQPILFTELGYPSVDGANLQPWAAIGDVPDRQEQADCLEAAYKVLTRRDWFRGVYWWHYFPGDRPMAEDLTLRGKIAEEVMSNWNQKMTPGEDGK
jgi:hypothetical protein